MTREVKIGTAVAGSFLSLVGIVVGTKMYKGEVPKTVEGALTAVASELKKDEVPPPVPQPTPPGPLALVSGDSLPLQQPSASIPTPPGGFGLPGELPPPPKGLPALPPVTGGAIGFPPETAPLTEAANDIGKTLAEQKARQEQIVREALEKKANEAKNNINQFAASVQEKTKDAINSLPALPSLPGSIEFPPAPGGGGINVADNTIVGGGGKKSNPIPVTPSTTPPAAPPAPPTPFGGELPMAPMPQPSTIVGGTPPAPAPTPAPFGTLPGVPDPKTSAPPSPPPFGTPAPETPRTIVGGSNNPTTNNPTTIKPKDNVPPIPGAPSDPFAAAPKPPIPGPQSDPFANAPKPPDNGFQPPPVTPAAPAFGTPPAPVPGPPTGFDNPPQPPAPKTDSLVAPMPPTQPPTVRTDSPDRYQCLGNENYALIAARKYGNENFARALEEYNRDLPGAADNVRAQPPRLQQGTIVFLPSQNYLSERYARFIGPHTSVPPAPPFAGASFGTPPAPVRPLGNDIGLTPPTPFTPKQPSPQPPSAVTDAGVTSYRVPTSGMYLSQVAERQLGSALRWIDIYRLNPGLQPEQPLREGIEIRVPVK